MTSNDDIRRNDSRRQEGGSHHHQPRPAGQPRLPAEGSRVQPPRSGMAEHGDGAIQGDADPAKHATQEQLASALEDSLEAIQAGEPPSFEDAQVIATTLSGEMRHSGPLPHPDLFAQYDSVVPGAGERILSMAEKSLELQGESIYTERIETKAEAFALRSVAGAYGLSVPLSFVLAIAGAFLEVDIMVWSGIALAALQTAPVAFEKIRSKPQQ